MPDKTLTVATYAAGASLAAITLIYVFGPTYFLDHGPAASSNRRKGVVGLSNPANDCFINSVLQALAGLGDLRLYLIRETHRRSLEDDLVYAQTAPVGSLPGDAEHFRSDTPEWKMEGFQKGIVTKGLKDILDALNERPIYKKTISAAPFVSVLEHAFRQRISRQQQDAQEFLQVVAERLCNEYHAGQRARNYARRKAGSSQRSTDGMPLNNGDFVTVVLQPDGVEGDVREHKVAEDNVEEGFPMEGRSESQIECLTCGFKPRPTTTPFCALTLNVPQVSATTLGLCFDGMFKTEYIDDFKCEKCRLLHAVTLLEAQAQKKTTPKDAKEKAQLAIQRLQQVLETDPENPPEDVPLPDLSSAPKRRIARHVRLTSFPRVLAIHLSRSIYHSSHSSQKNSAKVAFPEDLVLGGLLAQKKYRLLGLVTHRGSHDSGHYETFRRQSLQPPFSNSTTFRPSEAYSRTASPSPTPPSGAQHNGGDENSLPLTSDTLSPVPKLITQVPQHGSFTASPPKSVSIAPGNCEAASAPGQLSPMSTFRDKGREGGTRRTISSNARSTISKIAPGSSSRAGGDVVPSESSSVVVEQMATANSKRMKVQDRWWRISDDKVKEASTRDVLGMQREVYLLFYELECAST
ncbi:putative ubiquitin carboxyl-terminal hydrolase 16 [Podospora australis]|uniref:Ubiquitin carboxyl-terminal hydrolase n=1 Tax=Podospora australis TaxID=1536484 RepID=A0AAN6WN32_9PEZI|nr:putative ubiquitin carboxyl-terminal hydrolase 16 [Podospora australis]